MNNEILEKAVMIVNAIKNELALGTKHYHKSNGELITKPSEIARALKDNDLIIEPTAQRRHLFGG